MRLLCLCPTYGRPELLANALACFLAQDYPPALCHLAILDDLGQYGLCAAPGERVTLYSRDRRLSGLPEKYNWLLDSFGALYATSRWDAAVVWEDDDVYLPWHLSAIAGALRAGSEPAAKPWRIWSLYGATEPYAEDARGRFHGAMGVRMSHLRAIGGWPKTRRPDFDQIMLAACAPQADTMPYGNPHWPSFVFRWQSTGARHTQTVASSADDLDWYARVQPHDRTFVPLLKPQFDAETARIFQRLAR